MCMVLILSKRIYPFKRQPHNRLLPANCLSVFGHFVGLPLKGLKAESSVSICKPRHFNPFLVNVRILYPLETPENPRTSGVFRRYKKGILARNELIMYLNGNWPT